MVLIAGPEEPGDGAEHAGALVAPRHAAAVLESGLDFFEVGMDRGHTAKDGLAQTSDTGDEFNIDLPRTAGTPVHRRRDSVCRAPAQAADRRSRELINRRLRDDSLLGFACRPVRLYPRTAERNRVFSAVYPEEDFGAQYLVVCSPPLDNASCPLVRRPFRFSHD